MDKVLTIAVAAYHAAGYLKRGIPTFMDARVMNDIEVLIVDDGSGDDTGEVADYFQKKYPDTVVAVHKENGGHGSVINRGIDQARGRYYCIVDADDWVNSDGLLALVSELKKTDSDLVLTTAELRYEDNQLAGTWPIKKIPYGKEVLLSDYIAGIKKLDMHNCCMKTELLREHHVRCHENHFYADMEWILYSFLYVRTVTSLDIIFYQYLVGREGQSISIEGRKKHKKEYLEIGEWLSEFYQEKENQMSEPVKIFYKRRIAEFLTGFYSLQMSYRNREKKEELVRYDREIQNKYPEIYRANENLCVKLLRLSGFGLYGAAGWIYCKVNGIRSQ